MLGKILFLQNPNLLGKSDFLIPQNSQGAWLRSKERWLVEHAGGVPGHTHRIYDSGPQTNVFISISRKSI